MCSVSIYFDSTRQRFFVNFNVLVSFILSKWMRGSVFLWNGFHSILLRRGWSRFRSILHIVFAEVLELHRFFFSHGKLMREEFFLPENWPIPSPEAKPRITIDGVLDWAILLTSFSVMIRKSFDCKYQQMNAKKRSNSVWIGNSACWLNCSRVGSDGWNIWKRNTNTW